MKKLILASAAAFFLTAGLANAAIILQTDENDRKVWINTWAGQTEDKESGRTYGSSASTFSGVATYSNEKNTHEVFVGRFQGKPRGESVSTLSGHHSPGESVRGMFKNTHEVWISR